jgi:hypothetical protein
MDSQSNKRIKMTLLLDERSVAVLREFSYRQFGTTNVSKAIMEMAKDYENQQQQHKRAE